jgi:hypothetical protein
MAVVATDLAFIAGGGVGAPRLWSYVTADAKTVVDTSGYFNTLANVLNVGDFIFARCSKAGTETYGVLVVLTNTGSVVDVGDLVSFQSANTD